MTVSVLLAAVVGLACVGVAVAIALAALTITGRRTEPGERRDVMHCPQCRGAVSPLDRYCPACGRPLKPQEIERLDPNAR